MNTLKADDLTIQVENTAAGGFRLEWTGKSNSRDPGKILIPFFDEVLRRATPAGTPPRQVEMHFEKLEHFNSSTIATLIQLINAATRAHVPLKIHYDSSLRWQSLSFDALKRALRPFNNQETSVEFIHASG